MADLSYTQSSQEVTISGADSTGAETNPVSASVSGDLGVNDGISSGGVYGALALTANTAAELKVGASRLSPRKLVTCFSPTVVVYWGYSSSVTTATGTPLYMGILQQWALDATDTNAVIYLVSATATSVRITESP